MPKGIGYGAAGKASNMMGKGRSKKKAEKALKKRENSPIGRKRKQMRQADPSLTDKELDRVLPYPKGKK